MRLKPRRRFVMRSSVVEKLRRLPLTMLVALVCGGMFFALPMAVVQADGIGQMVDEILRSSYQHYLDDELYTHDGDSRGYRYGPEHDLARDNIFAHFEAEGLDTYLDPFEYGSNTYYNVVGIHEGVTNPEQIYIVGSHYDSDDNPGADDDGSGTAGVMEAARVMSDYRFDATIIFIAFDVEERGMIGSDAYATEHQGDDIRGMIELDMIAFNSNNQNRGSIYGRTASDPIKNALADALQTYGGLGVDMHGYMDRSDHAPFEWQGFDACLLIEYAFESNPNYHRITDSVDTPNYIDYEYATKMTKATVGCIAEMAGYVGPDEYTISEPWPGIANRTNTFYVTGATPGVTTFMVYGRFPGNTNVPNCPGLVVGIQWPSIFYRGVADANGALEFEQFVPRKARDQWVYFQGVEASTCKISNLVDILFE